MRGPSGLWWLRCELIARVISRVFCEWNSSQEHTSTTSSSNTTERASESAIAEKNWTIRNRELPGTGRGGRGLHMRVVDDHVVDCKQNGEEDSFHDFCGQG